jgi:L,D-transpeptidase ErfK/SrfK
MGRFSKQAMVLCPLSGDNANMHARHPNRAGAALFLAAVISLASGCQVIKSFTAENLPAPAPQLPIVPGDPRPTHEFVIGSDDDVIGVAQVTKSSAEDTFSDIARRFNLGYEELVRANPGVDPWLPGADREIILPTRFVLPDAPREGLVINLPALRVFYFPKAEDGEPQRVITHPIGIGKVGWSTPEGSTKVVSKRKNPIWTPPASVRKEHRENGDPLPRKVPPGPDNPLGAYAMNLGWESYLIHGTNKPYGVGMRSSHGCMRFYPEDIALLFDQIPIGTPVHVVNQPLLMGWHDGAIYVQALPVMEDDTRPPIDPASALLNSAISDRLWQKAKLHTVAVDLETVSKVANEKRGIALPVSKRSATRAVTQEQYLATMPRVHNRIPKGATWDGKEELLVTAEEYEAARSGKPLPKKSAGKNTPIKGASTGKPTSIKPADVKPASAGNAVSAVSAATPGVGGSR